MQRLILIRHAEAERDPPFGGGDYERGLTDRGRHEATRLGVRLAEAGVTPDLAIVSAAARARETWEYVAKAWGAVETRALRELYNAGPADLLAAAQAAAEATVVLVAHNPAAQALAVQLLRQSGDADAAREAERRFPTAGAVVAESPGGAAAPQVFLPADDPAEH